MGSSIGSSGAGCDGGSSSVPGTAGRAAGGRSISTCGSGCDGNSGSSGGSSMVSEQLAHSMGQTLLGCLTDLVEGLARHSKLLGMPERAQVRWDGFRGSSLSYFSPQCTVVCKIEQDS